MTSKLTSQLSFLALLVDVYRSRCLRPVSRWSPLSHYIRLHRLGAPPRPRLCHAPTAAPGHRPGAGRGQVCLGWAGVRWLVCAECQGYMPRCRCVVVTWLAGVRLTARWDQRLLLSPHSCCQLQLLSNTAAAVTSSTRKQPIPSHTILPCPASGQNLKQGRANIIDWIIFMGAVVEETILKECRGVLVASCECGWVGCCLSGQAGTSLPTLVSFSHRCCEDIHYSLFTLHELPRMMWLRCYYGSPIISYENNFPPRQHINNTNNLCIYCLL